MSDQPGTSPRLIVGLGNPGGKYEATRHNVGFMVLDQLARSRGISFDREKKWDVKVAREQVVGAPAPFWFAKPQTFMNLSGHAVSGIARFYRIPTEEILVIYDDVDLPLGTLRFRAKGSAGGHNGIKSIIECLGDDGFPRLKLGIAGERGRPTGGSMSSHVLGRFASEEKDKLDTMITQAATAVDLAISDGLGVAMNRFNRKPKKKKQPKPAEESPNVGEKDQNSQENANKESSPLHLSSEGAIDTDPKNTE